MAAEATNTALRGKMTGKQSGASKRQTPVAYLGSLYPPVSPRFIRREIVALEALGIAVKRFSIRPFSDDHIDPEDIAEREQTQVLLTWCGLGTVARAFPVFLGRPLRFLRALGLATRLGWRSRK